MGVAIVGGEISRGLKETVLIEDPLNPRRLSRSPGAGLRLREKGGGHKRTESRRTRVYWSVSRKKGAEGFKGMGAGATNPWFSTTSARGSAIDSLFVSDGSWS